MVKSCNKHSCQKVDGFDIQQIPYDIYKIGLSITLYTNIQFAYPCGGQNHLYNVTGQIIYEYAIQIRNIKMSLRCIFVLLSMIRETTTYISALS